MNKEIIINNVIYIFTYVEDLNSWIIYESERLFSGYNLELSLGLNYLKKDIDWEEIRWFLTYVQEVDKTKDEIINKSKRVLKELFKVNYKDVFNDETIRCIDFEITGIELKKVNVFKLYNEFEFDILLYPYDTLDRNKDVGTFIWRANVRANALQGVYCEDL